MSEPVSPTPPDEPSLSVQRTVAGVPWYGAPGKMQRRLASSVLIGQALVVFLGGQVARGVETATGRDDGLATTYFVGGAVLGVLFILTSGLLRRPWGITLGWALQVLTLASAFIVPAMVLVALAFGAIWAVALHQGARLDAMTVDWLAQYVHPDDVPEQEWRRHTGESPAIGDEGGNTGTPADVRDGEGHTGPRTPPPPGRSDAAAHDGAPTTPTDTSNENDKGA